MMQHGFAYIFFDGKINIKPFVAKKNKLVLQSKRYEKWLFASGTYNS